jgi:hypothetical protein
LGFSANGSLDRVDNQAYCGQRAYQNQICMNKLEAGHTWVSKRQCQGMGDCDEQSEPGKYTTEQREDYARDSREVFGNQDDEVTTSLVKQDEEYSPQA